MMIFYTFIVLVVTPSVIQVRASGSSPGAANSDVGSSYVEQMEQLFRWTSTKRPRFL